MDAISGYGIWECEGSATAGNMRQPILSVIIPTRNEAGNIVLLLSQLQVALQGIAVEIIFVDDSDDETPETVRQAAHRFPFRTVLIARAPNERGNGLGGAVVQGFRTARGAWWCVMDADLQHPPAMVPQLLAKAVKAEADLVMGTRLSVQGDTHGLGRWRTFVARFLALTTRLTFPMRLWRISDPLTGLFLIRRGSIDLERLQPDGFKILLEILVREPKLKVDEVPFTFEFRHAGESKAGVDEVVRLVRHYVRLRVSADSYLTRFLLVGVTGLILNTLLLRYTVESLDWHYTVSAIATAELATLWNYLLADYWVFDDRRERQSLAFRLGGFVLMNTIFLAVQIPLLTFLVMNGMVPYLIANILSIGVLTIGRFLISDQILWKRLRTQPLTRQ